jgi:hypothetical protein
MTRITTIAAATALMALASSSAFSQSSDGPIKPGDVMSSPHTGMGDNGSIQIDPVGNGPSSKYYQPPVATGLDLKGPAKTEGPFAE